MLMSARASHAVLLLPLVLLSACEKPKPKELPYDKLVYESKGVQAVFNDPETHRGFTGVSKNTDEKGRLIGEFHFKDGQLHGLVTEWYPTTCSNRMRMRRP